MTAVAAVATSRAARMRFAITLPPVCCLARKTHRALARPGHAGRARVSSTRLLLHVKQIVKLRRANPNALFDQFERLMAGGYAQQMGAEKKA